MVIHNVQKQTYWLRSQGLSPAVVTAVFSSQHQGVMEESVREKIIINDRHRTIKI